MSIENNIYNENTREPLHCVMVNKFDSLGQLRLSSEFYPHWVPLNLDLALQLSYA